MFMGYRLIYDGVGVVKRHSFLREPEAASRAARRFLPGRSSKTLDVANGSLQSRLDEALGFVLHRIVSLVRPRLGHLILWWNRVPPVIYSVSVLPTMICSPNSPSFGGRGKAPNQNRGELPSTISLSGPPCWLTRCVGTAAVRSILNNRTANFLAIAILATPVPRRYFKRR
jgi:hypothetical protein